MSGVRSSAPAFGSSGELIPKVLPEPTHGAIPVIDHLPPGWMTMQTPPTGQALSGGAGPPPDTTRSHDQTTARSAEPAAYWSKRGLRSPYIYRASPLARQNDHAGRPARPEVTRRPKQPLVRPWRLWCGNAMAIAHLDQSLAKAPGICWMDAEQH